MAKKKCCGKHCFHVLCFPVWGVIIIGIALGLFLLFFDCSVMMEIPFEDFTLTMLFLSTACIFFVVLLAIVYLILIKIPAKCGFCSWFKNILLIIHLLFLAISGYMICTYQDHSLEDVINILTKTKRIQDPPGKLSSFFMDFQKSQNCCGLKNSSDYGVAILPRTLISTCPKGTVSTGSTPAPVVPRVTPIKVKPTGCAVKLLDTYQDCDKASCRYTLVMLVLGVIPFICYTLVYRQARKEQKKEEDAEAAAEEDEEEEDAEENRDETAARRSQLQNPNQNNNINNNNNNNTNQALPNNNVNISNQNNANNANPPPQAPMPQANNARVANASSTPTPTNV